MNLDKQKNTNVYEIYSKSSINFEVCSILKKRILIGSSQICDVLLPFQGISPIHAVIEIITEGQFKIYDMNSSSGTRINGQKVVTGILNGGEIISFGNIEFGIRQQDTSTQLPPPIKAPLEILEKPYHPTRRSIPRPPVQSPAALPPGPPSGVPSTPSARPAPSHHRVEVAPEYTPEEVPIIEYPLAKDPRAEFSEYIFEDVETLYPIFNYEVGKSAVEVIIIFKDLIQSIDYIPEKDGTYNLVNRMPSNKEIEFPYLGNNQKVPLVEIKNGEIFVHTPQGFEFKSLGEENRSSGTAFCLKNDEIVCFSKKNMQIFVRQTEAPPKVKCAPLIRRDPEFKKYLALIFLFAIPFMIAMSSYVVNKKADEEKAPERIATILYKRKKIIKKQPRPKPKIVKKKKPAAKTPAPKKVEKPKPKVAVKKSKPKKIVKPKVAAKKPAPKKPAKVKKASPKKGPTNKLTRVRKKASNKDGGRKPRTTPRPVKRKSNVASKGAVETYKSFNFKSSVSSLVRKGGGVRGAVSARGTVSNIGDSSLAQAGRSATARTARVNTSVGNIAGAARGTLDTQRGVSGLVSKSGIYTSGLPYKTVILGGMSPDIIRKILIDNIPKFRYCYQSELGQAPESSGGVVRLNFVIGASGHVSKAGLSSVSSLSNNVKSCVVRVLKGIRFPRPSGGGVVEVNQPINFYPKAR